MDHGELIAGQKLNCGIGKWDEVTDENGYNIHQKLNCNRGICKCHANIRMGMDAGLGANPAVFENKIPPGGIIHDFYLGDKIFFSKALGENRILSGLVSEYYFKTEENGGK